MDSLPEEIFVCVVCNLDGDAYLAFSCVSRTLQGLLNEKRLLEQVTRANVPGAEIVDAAYYGYCYSQYYLTAHPLRNEGSFYEVLKRTLHERRVSPATMRALEERVVSLMTAYLKYLDIDSINEIKRIHRRILTQIPYIAKEISSFFYVYEMELLDVTKFPKPMYLQKAKEGDLQWFKEGGEIGHAFSALFQAVRYGRHEVARFLVKTSKDRLATDDFSIFSFFGLPLDGEMMRLLIECNRRQKTLNRSSVTWLIQNDRTEAFAVLLSSYSLKTDELKYYLRIAIQADSLGCFRALTRYLPMVESKLEVRNLVIKNKSYRIWKYYRMEKGFADSLFEFVLGSSVAAY